MKSADTYTDPVDDSMSDDTDTTPPPSTHLAHQVHHQVVVVHHGGYTNVTCRTNKWIGCTENRNPESRVLDIFGQILLLRVTGPVGVGGALAYQLFSITDKGIKYQQAHASGLATIEADQTLEIQTGKKNKSGRVSYVAMAHNGDMNDSC